MNFVTPALPEKVFRRPRDAKILRMLLVLISEAKRIRAEKNVPWVGLPHSEAYEKYSEYRRVYHLAEIAEAVISRPDVYRPAFLMTSFIRCGSCFDANSCNEAWNEIGGLLEGKTTDIHDSVLEGIPTLILGASPGPEAA